MNPKINNIAIENGDPTTDAHGEFYPKVEINRGAHWYNDEDGERCYTAGIPKTYYFVSVLSLIRCFRAVMVLEARNQPKKATVMNQSRRLRKGKSQ